ncbi:MAG: Hsp20/alpha crystallin family protein [Anaerolineales bacterium]|nr:Hsp20/alpha crystallin family protein [Anaerolineales bacterium]
MRQVVKTEYPALRLLNVLNANDDFFTEEMAGRKVLRHARAWRPPTDLCETEDSIIARIEIAGMREGNLNVSINDKVLTVSGIRTGANFKGAYYQMEIQYGEFLTQVRLPAAVDEEKVEAAYTDGFLTVKMPKRKALRVTIK